ncbi:amidohydrolase [Nocardioides zeae]|uniref:Amidohydrolase n=1 Tax=Nocardioides imazamoxiresistens TaxID=3231893 RepID=A0ABU3PVI0_9ACTN|nr:amidohydrolase [Nocardioides zeae]MDT9592755.1 amidohydrolase [Nocardioides zeae]
MHATSEILSTLAPELVAVRRDIHAHPELSWQESRTTTLLAERLSTAGIAHTRLTRSGLVAEVGTAGPLVALRGDLDALPVPERSGVPWSSTVPGVTHACGHDLHAAALLGAALTLHELDRAGRLPGRVRLVFQPAEEVMPGGALDAIASGALEGVEAIVALHCDPSIDVGRVGVVEGPITGAADHLVVDLAGRGGHTSRPHLTEDLTFALGKLLTELPAVLSRRIDPRAGVSVVWGQVEAGVAPNVIPAEGRMSGTVRMLDAEAWLVAEDVVRRAVQLLAEPYGVEAVVTYTRGVPPVVNDPGSTAALRRAVLSVLGPDGIVGTRQSLGGEDFGWYLQHVPGALARLGTRTPGGRTYDLHQGDLVVDELALTHGAAVLTEAALELLAGGPGRSVVGD